MLAHFVHTGCVDLFLEASLRAVKLQEEGRGDRVGQRAELVACIDHHIIQELWIVQTLAVRTHRV